MRSVAFCFLLCNVQSISMAETQAKDFILVATGYPETESQTTEILDWHKKKPCPSNASSMFPTRLMLAAGGILDKKPTICGGFDERCDYNTRRECWQLINGKWIEAEFSLKTKRRNHASLIINNQMILTGGWYWRYGYLSSTEIISNGTILDGPELQSAIYGHCMVSHHSRIYIIGGMENDTQTAKTWIHSYDMDFIKEGPRMRSERYYHGCAKLNIMDFESIIVVGSSEGTQMNTAEFLDPKTSSWIEIAQKLPTSMNLGPSVLATPNKNAVIVYTGKVYQVLSDDGEFHFQEIMKFSSIEKKFAVAFFLPKNDTNFQGC